MKTAVITIRTEPELKAKVEELYAHFGITVTDAVNMFFHKSLMNGGLPFKPSDPFYSEENIKHLEEAFARLKAGQSTVHELIEVEDDD